MILCPLVYKSTVDRRPPTVDRRMSVPSGPACVHEVHDEPPKNCTGRPLDSPVLPVSGTDILNQHTFQVTISPKGDVSPECERSLLKWVENTTSHAYVVAERGKNGQRHLHMCLAFDAARSKQRLQEDTWKFRVKKWHGDSIGKYAVVVTTMYDHRWYDEYLKKETGVEVLYNEYDRDAVTKLFPSPQVQQLLVESKGKRVSDTYIHEHCLLWSETQLPLSVSGALRYLRERMFVERSMMVIQDERRVRQLALALYRYRSKDPDQSPEDEAWLDRVQTKPIERQPPYVHVQRSAAPP